MSSRPPSNRIRFLVVDDHFVVRMGLVASINTEDDLLVVAAAIPTSNTTARSTAALPRFSTTIRLIGMGSR